MRANSRPGLRRLNRRYVLTPWGVEWIYSATFARILSARWRRKQRVMKEVWGD